MKKFCGFTKSSRCTSEADKNLPVKLPSRSTAFTLAEVLIALGIVGIVSAMTLPSFITNIRENIRREQVRNVKYKLTQATDKMKSMGLLIESYPNTIDFVNELKKHYKIIKVCDNQHLTECWPTKKISTVDGDINVSTLQKGSNLKSLGIGTKGTDTVGIVTADGTPMILTYSPVCTPLDAERTYSWSTVDNKPETNATTNCISAIFDINGKSGPNRIGKDVRTLNSILGFKKYDPTPVSKSVCEDLKKRKLVNDCYYDNNNDYFAGAVKKCNDVGLHLPSMQTLANIAGAMYGRSDIGPYTLITSNGYARSNEGDGGGKCCATRSNSGTCTERRACVDCEDYYKNFYVWSSESNDDRISSADRIICLPSGGFYDTNGSAIGSIVGHFWSSAEVSFSLAQRRTISNDYSYSSNYSRVNPLVPLCVGD